MKRILMATAPFLTAAMLLAGPAVATTKVTCKQIRAEIATGKTPASVAKELKVSQKTVDHCNAKVASNKHTRASHSMQGSPPAQ